MKCRFCDFKLDSVFMDLINAPASNAYLTREGLDETEKFYPLRIYTCNSCKLVQVAEYIKSAEIFDDEYAYFSSFSSSWLQHAEKYVDMITERLNLGENSLVTEIAANDGYLLQYFKEKNIPCLGVEPTANTAAVAREKGIPMQVDFFGKEFSKTLEKSDLILGNNVLAHVPDICDFVQGLKIALKEHGAVTFEFPHLMQLIKYNQFDTIYHEHFSYFSLYTVIQIFSKYGLRIYDVEELATHGGSLRIYGCHDENTMLSNTKNIQNLLDKERAFGIMDNAVYEEFHIHAEKVKNDFLEFLISLKREGKRVVAYGAAAKGNTFLNYAGIKKDLIEFVVDKSPYKQGKYMPASHIPIEDEGYLKVQKPDYIVILPWNLKSEIEKQLIYTRDWGAKLVVAIPRLEVIGE